MHKSDSFVDLLQNNENKESDREGREESYEAATKMGEQEELLVWGLRRMMG